MAIQGCKQKSYNQKRYDFFFKTQAVMITWFKYNEDIRYRKTMYYQINRQYNKVWLEPRASPFSLRNSASQNKWNIITLAL
jgi:hypothetical protein